MKIETKNLKDLLVKGINNNIICFDKLSEPGKLSKSLLFSMIMYGRRFSQDIKLKKIYISSDDWIQELLVDYSFCSDFTKDITLIESLFFGRTELILSSYLSSDWRKDFENEKATYAPNKKELVIGIGEYKYGNSIITDEYILLGMY